MCDIFPRTLPFRYEAIRAGHLALQPIDSRWLALDVGPYYTFLPFIQSETHF